MSETDIKKLEELVKIMPENGKVRLALGKAYLANGRLDDAKIQIEESLNFEEDNPESYLKLGNIYSEKKMHEDAINNYQKAILIDQYYVEAIYCLGMSFVETKKIDDANSIIDRLEQLHPVWAKALRNYLSKSTV